MLALSGHLFVDVSKGAAEHFFPRRSRSVRELQDARDFGSSHFAQELTHCPQRALLSAEHLMRQSISQGGELLGSAAGTDVSIGGRPVRALFRVHLLHDLRFPDAPQIVHVNALRWQDLPEFSNEGIATHSLLWGDLAAGIDLEGHGGGW